MRTLLVALFLLLFFIISIPLYLILLIIGLFNPKQKHKISQRIVSTVCKIILFLSGVKLTVMGISNIPEDESVLFVFNHRSYYDILVSYASVPKLSAFIAKKELKRFPFINVWISFVNSLFIDRDDIRQSLKIILEAVEIVKDGYSIFISPEGTRNSEKDLLPFKEGSFKIAEKTSCPIIPVSINNADSVFEKHVPWVKKSHIIIEYGEPIYSKELDRSTHKSLAKYVQNIIADTLEKNDTRLEF